MTDAVQYLATIPSPTQSVWHLWFLPIRAYAVFIILGIVAACWVTEARLRQRGAPKWLVLDIALWAVPFGLLGGRIYHVITSPDAYFGRGGHPWQVFSVWEGGLGIWGAVALGAVGAWIACRRMGIPLTLVADALAPGLPLAQGIGRLGNYFNNELYGSHTNLPWGLKVYEWDLTAGRPYTAGGHPILVAGGPFHPTFLYELLWDVGVALLVYFLDRRYAFGKGRAFAIYVAGYTVGRFWIEALRIDDAHHFLGLRLNDWVSILVFAGAVTYLFRVHGVQEHMRVADDGTITIVDPAGKPIPYYKPFTPPAQDGGKGDGTGNPPEWWLTTKRRAAGIWTSVTSRWAGDDDEGKSDKRPGQPAGSVRDKK